MKSEGGKPKGVSRALAAKPVVRAVAGRKPRATPPARPSAKAKQAAVLARQASAKQKTKARPKAKSPPSASAFATVPSVMLSLMSQASASAASVSMRYFKTGVGEYGAGDKFLGIKVPVLRKLAKNVAAGGLPLARALLKSAWHEARLLALFALVQLYQRGDEPMRQRVFDLYLANTRYINNWDMVDSSAPHIVGAHLMENPAERKSVLDRLARSESLWERRIAMLATQHFIRNGEITETLRLAKMVLHDPEDLMHKATGWMLREALQRADAARAELVMRFLRQHQNDMPRTTLRYAIERLAANQRKLFLAGIA